MSAEMLHWEPFPREESAIKKMPQYTVIAELRRESVSRVFRILFS